ncbi:nucleotidyltransferase domain-containing protein [bacterium]|nr:nucleotidyltransferase domain-containing protein [bacterium]
MVNERAIVALSEQIARDFEPERIILFGSHATGRAGADSDVDILVVLPFDGRGFDKSLEILNQTDPQFPIDLIARRPEDVERRYSEGDPLVREALDHGRVLYERDG